jgi:hypothetical protein
MLEFDMVKLMILLLTGSFIEFDCSRYQCSSKRLFFYYLEIQGKLTGLSNQFKPSMVFDPSEFEGPRFDCNSIMFTIETLSVINNHHTFSMKKFTHLQGYSSLS